MLQNNIYPFKSSGVEGQWQGQRPTTPQQSRGEPQPLFCDLSFWIHSQKSPPCVLFSPGRPQSHCHLKSSFLDRSSRAGGGGYHKVVAFIGTFFFNIYILYICIYSNIFSIHNQVSFCFTLAIQAGCSALCQCVCSPPVGSCGGREGGVSGLGT